jgi:hypothetical protein
MNYAQVHKDKEAPYFQVMGHGSMVQPFQIEEKVVLEGC